ncbi:MoxR family ATPase [Reinekea sp. G2M2-21]|uniref:AAA family ATPase n=1 Tax=Reinekea sp. G2M2-21 TaxID=2788942 RepID=UPI0018A8FD29|nr:MoxR family ATPase [Reinekea sp. G2M2-21]
MARIAQVTDQLVKQASRVVAGKSEQIRLIWVSLLCGGHVLLEDLPGVGKTTLAQSLGNLLGLKYQRVQFTADLLPSDIIGAQIFDRDRQEFKFHRGPVFTQLLLADELNRATPKAQSALLEAMEENQVSIDGQAEPLPQPFFVIATQNPQTQSGTYPLPESQLDRFFMRLTLGYPAEQVEKELLMGRVGRVNLNALEPLFSVDEFLAMRALVREVQVSDAILNYLMRLVQRTRDNALCALGLSPRASQSLAMASRAYAATFSRDYVTPDDVQAVFPSVAGHRLKAHRSLSTDLLVSQILESVDVIGE